MHRYWITSSAAIVAIIAAWTSHIPSANALVVRDVETCVRVCLIQFNRYGDIYAAMQCIGACSRYAPRGLAAQYRWRGELTRNDCRETARAVFPDDRSQRRGLARWCRIHLN